MNRKLCIYDDGVIFNTDLNSVNVLSAIILNSPEEIAEYDSLDVRCGIVDRHISKKEMSFQQFYKEMASNVVSNSRNYRVSFDENRKCFAVVFRGIKYNLYLGEERMDSYIAGNYDDATKKLFELTNACAEFIKNTDITDKINQNELELTNNNIEIYEKVTRADIALQAKSILSGIIRLSIAPLGLIYGVTSFDHNYLLGFLGFAIAIAGSFPMATQLSLSNNKGIFSSIRKIINNLNKLYNLRNYSSLTMPPEEPKEIPNDGVVNGINSLLEMCLALPEEVRKDYLQVVKALLVEYQTSYQELITKAEESSLPIDFEKEEETLRVNTMSKIVDLFMTITDEQIMINNPSSTCEVVEQVETHGQVQAMSH